MSKPSARTTSQTSRSFFPVANAASISGQIHATRPVLVAGSIPGSERRFTSSDFVLFRSGKAELADVARTKPLHIRAQNGISGQELQIYLLATIRNRSKQPATAGRDLGQRQPFATVCNQSAVQKGSKDRVAEHKGIVERVGFLHSQRVCGQYFPPWEQLDNLVAPIALYPDPLLGQVLAASTYPLELVEANQFVQQNGNLHGQDPMNAAREQNWDPSVQALVAFPNVLTLLTSNVRWTTDLGNAFLAQQQDLMAAMQRMRGRAQSNGRLYSNPQQTVSTETQNGQSAVEIEPANPDYIDVPNYNPDYVWGPPEEGYYPPLWYPPVAYGFGFDPGIYLGAFFPGWSWGCGWFGGGLFVNVGFFNHWGFHGYVGSRFAGGFGAGRFGWEHDPFHRAGVPYANRTVAARFSNSPRFAEGRAAPTNTVRQGASPLTCSPPSLYKVNSHYLRAASALG